MTKKLQIYKCEICGNIVEVLHAGKGELVCCGQPMKLMEEKVQEEGAEKHLPVVEKLKDRIIVKVGSVQHPMEDKHYIEWIEVIGEKESFRKFFMPGSAPEVEFPVAKLKEVRTYCNIHGLWSRKFS